MAPTPREIVLRTLNFDNPPRVPRQLWTVPWAGLHHPRELEEIVRDFPPDITGADGHLRERAPRPATPTLSASTPIRGAAASRTFRPA